MMRESRPTNESTAGQQLRGGQRGGQERRSPSSKGDQNSGEQQQRFATAGSSKTYSDGPPIVVPDLPEEIDDEEGFQLGELKHLEVSTS